MPKTFLRNLWSGALPAPAVFGLLVALSLLVRLPIAIRVTQADMPLRSDEYVYTDRALAVKEMLTQGGNLTADERETLRGKFFGGGRTGPVHPLLLAIAAQPGDDPDVQPMRFVVVVVSALTTGVVYLLTRRIFDHQPGLIAAGIHLLSSQFIGFSNLLWAESTFILFSTLAFYVSTFLLDERAFKTKLLVAAGVGATWGLAGMSRPTGLAYLTLTTLWVALNQKTWRTRLAVPAVMLAAIAITVLPWEIELYHQTRDFQMLATRLGLNLFRGNTPEGMTEGDVYAQASSYSGDIDNLFQEIAIQEIKSNPGAALARGFYRMRLNWSIDDFLQRHLYRGVYPPMPLGVFAVWYVWAFVLHFAILISAGAGFRLKLLPLTHFSTLLLLVLLSNQAYPMIMTGGSTRFTPVNLALMLPSAAYGLLHFREFAQTKLKSVAILAMSIFPLLTITTLPTYFTPPYVSSAYAPLFRVTSSLTAKDPLVVDLVEFNFRLRNTGPVEVTILEDGYWLDEQGVTSVTLDSAGPRHSTRRFDYDLMLFSYDWEAPPTLQLALLDSGETIIIQPITRETWNQWAETDLPDVRAMWVPNSTTELPDDAGESD